MKDFACKNEVIAKFNNRKPISQIEKELTFKISEDSIIQMIWEYLIENNIILLHDPSSKENQQYDIVKKVGRFGKTHFEAVKRNLINDNDYELIDIGKIRSDKNVLNSYDDFERELIEKLPFDDRVYYKNIANKDWRKNG